MVDGVADATADPTEPYKDILRRMLPEHAERWGLHITDVETEGCVWPIVVRVSAFDGTGSTRLVTDLDDMADLADRSAGSWGDASMNLICALLLEQLHAGR